MLVLGGTAVIAALEISPKFKKRKVYRTWCMYRLYMGLCKRENTEHCAL